MKPRYDALANGELGEVAGQGGEPVEALLSELFHARILPGKAETGMAALARGWKEFVELERRFGRSR